MTRSFLSRRWLISAVFAGAALMFLAPPALAKVGQVSTWMGGLYYGDGHDANTANLDVPRGFTADAGCSLYIADTLNRVIRKIDGTTNIISTYAGTGQYGAANGPRKQATFQSPWDVALGPSGELFVVDNATSSVRRISSGQVQTWLTKLHQPTGILIDGTTMYISDTAANRILKGSTTGTTTSVVATGITAPGKLAISGSLLYVVYNNGAGFGKVDLTSGTFTALKTDFINADGLTVHGGQVYIVSGIHGVLNDLVRYNPATDTFTTLQSVPETEWYNHASDILFCGSTIRMLFSGGSSVYRMDDDGGNPVKTAGVSRWNDTDGLRTAAKIGRPWVLTLSADKQKLFMFVNERLKLFNFQTNKISTLAGGQGDNYVDGPGNVARVSGPMQMVLSPKGTTIYIADRNNNRIRVFNRTTGAMSTLTGSGEVNSFNETKNAYAEGQPCTTFALGVAGCAYFDRPMGLAISPDGKTLYVSDSHNHRIRTINTTTGKTALLAGSGKAGMKDGAATQARFNNPVSLLMSADNKTLYVVDQGNNAIRAINIKTKRVTTIIGSGKGGYRDGSFKNARLKLPNYLALGPKNILYLSEGGTLRIRKLNMATRTISTLAGSGRRGSRNGAPNVASFMNPRQLVMINSSTLLVADDTNDMIRAISLK